MGILEVRDLSKRFGGLVANNRIDMTVEEEEIIGLIGPNGAGKTTLFNCIAGFFPPSGGKIFFSGEDVTNDAPEVRCHKGIARTFQVVRVFKEMTVLENVMVGAFSRRSKIEPTRRKALEVLDFAGLQDVGRQLAGSLTIADKKRLEVAKALATDPKLLMLDEALAGLNPTETAAAVRLVQRTRDLGVTVIMVEHVMEAIMPISDRVVVLEYGAKIAEGKPEQIIHDPKVITAYLGEKYHAKSR
jgi:branched-chain amino acid transport system ATP-binding protein